MESVGAKTPLSVRGVSVRREQRPVLADVDFSLLTGEMLVLLGPNGVGKTTLLDCVSGEITPVAGTVC